MPAWLTKLIDLILEFFKSNPVEPVKLPIPEAPKPLPSDERYKLRLVDSRVVQSGLKLFRLELKQGENTIDGISVVSGQPGRQTLRQGQASKAGSMEPLPEGYYAVGALEWASGKKGDYSKSWGTGLGPVWSSITPKMTTQRSALGFHLDENASVAPGTAGCVGFKTLAELKRFVSWFNQPNLAPKELTVNYDLGSVETKPREPGDVKSPFEFIQSPNTNSYRDSKVTHIVLHNTEGSLESAVSHFKNPNAQVSAHYIVARSGKVVQMVKDEHTAWHAGDREMNHKSIGIEIEAGKTMKGMTPIQEKAVVDLIEHLAAKHKIQTGNIIPHRHATATDCPGSIWPTDQDLNTWKERNLG